MFIYHCKHRGRLKEATKSVRRPPCATKKQSSLYRLQRSASTIASSPPRTFSLAVFSDLSSLHLSLSLSFSRYATSSSFYKREFFLSCSRFDPDFVAIVIYSSISEWRRESEWNARRKDQPVDCRSTQTIVKSGRHKLAVSQRNVRPAHYIVNADEDAEEEGDSREGLKSERSF